MSSNLINFTAIVLILLYFYRKPSTGILVSFLVILALPTTFSYFGFSFGIGEKYLPNIFLIELFFTFYYFIKAGRRNSIEGCDIALIIYILTVTIISLLVAEFSLNPGVLVKQFIIFPLFYFMGKVFLGEERQIGENYLRFRTILFALGPYMLFFVGLEIFTKTNIHAFLLSYFGEFVGSAVIEDPVQLLMSQLRSSFYRALGPQVEATEAALVTGIAYIGYLSWMNIFSPAKKIIRVLMLFLVLCTIILLSTRSVILMLLPLFTVRVIYGSKTKKWLSFFCVLTSILFLLFMVMDVGGILSTILESISRTAYYSDRLVNPEQILGRLWIWGDAWQLIKDNILFGVGIGVPIYLLGRVGSIYTTHNFYLDILLFQGAFVSCFLIGLWVQLIRRSLYIARNYRGSLFGEIAMAHLLVTVGMLTFALASPEKIQISSLFWFYGGMAASIKSKSGF